MIIAVAIAVFVVLILFLGLYFSGDEEDKP
jgi:hypothetical protein